LTLLPRELALAIAGGSGRHRFALGGKKRRLALANLRIAYPGLPDEELERIGGESFANLSRAGVALARSFHWDAEKVRRHVPAQGIEHVNDALSRGRGAIGLSLHIGIWDLCVRSIQAHGVPVSSVGLAPRNPLLRDWLGRMRASFGAEVIWSDNAAPSMLRALRKGRLLAVLNDQYSRRARAVFAPLFGIRCSTSAGIATLALRARVPILPYYSLLEGPDRFRLIFERPVEWEATGDRRADIELVTAACNRTIERIIRENPEQWTWSHPRFLGSPDLDVDPYEAGARSSRAVSTRYSSAG
jgi:KDO2-lipid IV(A) lauroyltransferase